MKHFKSIWFLGCLCALLLFGSGQDVLAMGEEESSGFETPVFLSEGAFRNASGLTYTCNNPIWNETEGIYEYLTYVVPSPVCSVGIDVSKWQGSIDWNKVKSCGIDFAFLRVGGRGSDNGLIELDPYFRENIKNAKAAGIQVGVYFFSQATTTEEAREEAAFALHQVAGYPLDLPIVMDYEFRNNGRLNQAYDSKRLNAASATEVCLAFCELVEAYGYASMVYANQNMLTVYLDGERLSRETEVWLARYSTDNAYHHAYSFWQFTSKGYVEGVNSQFVDLNFRFSGKLYPSGGGFFPFLDVRGGDWYYDAVKYAYDSYLFNGTEWDRFSPYEEMTRAMMVSVLYRMEGSPTVKGNSKFHDLTLDWYRNAVLWGEQTGVVSGTSATTFEPDAPLTREEMVTFLQRYTAYKGQSTAANGHLSAFPDGNQTSQWAKKAMEWAIGNGYIRGFEDSTLRPLITTNRAEVATVLQNLNKTP